MKKLGTLNLFIQKLVHRTFLFISFSTVINSRMEFRLKLFHFVQNIYCGTCKMKCFELFWNAPLKFFSETVNIDNVLFSFFFICYFIRSYIILFPSYRIAIAPSQFLYQIGLLFPLGQIFWGMIFITERDWKASILKVIQSVSNSFQSAPKT